MTTDKKISVVIPYYKGERYIAQAVASVANQPYKNVEILLINDGSPDNGDAVCQALAAKFPSVRYYKKQNEGIGPTRNFGVDHATGTYIAFLDQDDVWVKNFLDADTVDAIFNGGGVVGFSYYHCNEDFSRGRSDFVPDKAVICEGVKAAIEIWQHHSSMFFRREDILKNGIRAPKTRHEDEVFRRKCLYVADRVTRIDKLMFLYRNNPASEAHRNVKVETLYGPLLQSWKELLLWQKERNPDDLEIQASYQTLFCVYVLEGLKLLCATKQSKREIERIARECLFLDDAIEYMASMRDRELCKRIEKYLNQPRRFIRENRVEGYKRRFGRMLLKIPFIKSAYIKKVYPTDLSKMDLL